ncbi:hypothetical protein LCGC14_1502740 [marine sediment metagenome]|uniref:Uncharacterized protein n=1 Tax=marine sediment metagenome TaxID=412755 RepID=A0A0F9J3P5_9ZZZZ
MLLKMVNFDREPKNPFCLCLVCGSIITIGLFSSLAFNAYSLSYFSIVAFFLRELWVFYLIFTVGIIMIIIGIFLLIQKTKFELSRKRVICPSCKTTLESLENIGTYQCPECKKKFRAKVNHITSKTRALDSSQQFIFYQRKKEK